MHGRPIRTSLGSEPYGSALVCTGPKSVILCYSEYSLLDPITAQCLFKLGMYIRARSTAKSKSDISVPSAFHLP